MADLQIFAAESLQAIRAKADTLLARVDALAVTAPTLPEAQELLKNAQMLASYIEQQRTAAKAPYLEKGREPKRETVECFLIVTARTPSLEFQGTIDLIDGKPDLSTLKIAEDAL